MNWGGFLDAGKDMLSDRLGGGAEEPQPEGKNRASRTVSIRGSFLSEDQVGTFSPSNPSVGEALAKFSILNIENALLSPCECFNVSD